MQGPTTALIVIGLYVVVQILESSIITPQIQKKMINMPPALIIIAQLVMGIFAGILGLALATPIVAIIIVLVKELYIKKLKQI
jgi:predicted PurR-regulated permease PerM